MESCDSTHDESEESLFVRIIYINSLDCRLIKTVDTPHIVKYGESLLPALFIVRSLQWTPEGTMKQKMNYPCQVLLTKNILKESKIWVS